MSAYTIHEAKTRAELDAIVDILWSVRFSPFLPSTALSQPIFGYTSADRERSLTECKDRTWTDHERFLAQAEQGIPLDEQLLPTKPTRTWLYVRDAESGQAVGCARFDFMVASPFPNGCPQVKLSFWPEGEARKCGEFLMQQCYVPRAMWMQRPHGGFGAMAVLPAFRNRGIGSMLARWATAKLDDLGIEGFVESTEKAVSLYEGSGFITVMKLAFFIPSDAPEEWAMWYHNFNPGLWNAMWRPVGGKIVEGQRSRPWQLGSSIPV